MAARLVSLLPFFCLKPCVPGDAVMHRMVHQPIRIELPEEPFKEMQAKRVKILVGLKLMPIFAKR
jgi:hypothetical protein